MDAVFHEKQEGSLCAQHCLNALLQGEYFTAVDLSVLAQHLDEAERQRMAEGGVDSEEYRRFMNQPSPNMDDSGYFSIQVITSALKVWNIELVLYNSSDPVAMGAKQSPIEERAFICNYRDHWFTIRKLGFQWFNLNSILLGPHLISDTYLAMFLAQLEKEGYSIFIVKGDLPDCEADQLLKLVPAVQTTQNKVPSDNTLEGAGGQEKLSEDEESQLKAALRLSLQEDTALSECIDVAPGPSVDQHEVRQKRAAFLSRLENSRTSDDNVATSSTSTVDDMIEAEMLEEALKMSLESS